MTHFYYLISLLISIGGLATIDRRFRLALWHNRRATLQTIGCGVLLFAVWDGIGIGFGIFRPGSSSYSLPFQLAPGFQLEELFFLTLLCYLTLLIYQGAQRWRRT